MTRRRRIVVVCACVAAALLAALLWWALRTPSEQPFWDYVAAMKAAGEPTTFEEFAGPMPPDAENAAPEIDAALADVENEFGSEWKWPKGVATEYRLFDSRRPTLTDAEAKALADFADGLKPFADRVAAALDRPRYRYALVLRSNGLVDASFEDRADRVAVLLAVRARFARGRDGRLEGCRTLARLAGRFESDTYVDSIPDGALFACAAALRDGATSGVWDAKVARGVMDGLLLRPWLPRVSRSLRAGRVAVSRRYAMLLAGRLPSETERLGVTMSSWQKLKRVGRRVAGHRVYPAFEPGMAEVVVAECELTRRGAELPTTSYVVFAEEFGALLAAPGFVGMKEPYSEFANSLASSDGRARLTRVALAIAKFRGTHGDFPSSLDDLRGAFPDGVPLDPFTDAAFVYERTADGVRVASRGRLAPEPAMTFDEAAGALLGWELKR